MDARPIGTTAAFVVLAAATAGAQALPTLGLGISYPAAAGIVWNVSDRVALWPELTIARHVSTSYNAASTDVNAIGVAARALFYTSRIDAFRTYVAPEFTYGRQHSTGSASILSATAPGPESTSSSYGVTGSYGAQYVLGAHFGVFGEFGVEYTRQTVTTNIASQTVSKTRGNTIGTASRVGVIVYF